MDLLQTILLALIQGLTEFLPISSSAHLILPNQLLGWQDQGLAFDVAVHFGSLIAVFVYFRKDIIAMMVAWFGQFGSAGHTSDSRLAWLIILATIPAGLAGLAFEHIIETQLRSGFVIGITTVVFGLALWFADVRPNAGKNIYQIGILAALMIGVAQAFALIPGTSRSGVTITAALLLGFARTDAARFSFYLSIPIIVLGAGLQTLELLGEADIPWFEIALGTAVSGISAYLCIHFFLAFIERIGMLPFVLYRLVLGGFLLVLFW
jgi:undecaprenyl-diphosphatase